MPARPCTEQERAESGAPAVAGRVLLKATGPVPYVYVLASELPAGPDATTASVLVNLRHTEWSADEPWPLGHVASKPGTGAAAPPAAAEPATPVPRSKSAPAPAAPRTPHKDAASAAAAKPAATPAARTPARTPVTATSQPVYAPHLDVAEALRQVEQGTLHRGQLRVNAKNPRQAFVSVPTRSLDAIGALGWTGTNLVLAGHRRCRLMGVGAGHQA